MYWLVMVPALLWRCHAATSATYNFAKHFNIPITNIIGDAYNGEEANPTKDAILQNSGFINGMVMRDAMTVAIDKLEEMGIGKRQVNYRMRDAGFSRQRYWGEPFPIVYKDGVPYPLSENELPVELPHVRKLWSRPRRRRAAGEYCRIGL